MESYSKAAMERAMKVQEVILRAIAKRITWWQAAEIIGISDRQMRRWRARYEEYGFRGLFEERPAGLSQYPQLPSRRLKNTKFGNRIPMEWEIRRQRGV